MKKSLFLAVCLVASSVMAATKSVLPFIKDDFAKARAQAKAKKLPIFVEVGAPWCHSCVVFEQHVLTDAALAKDAPRFVWLSIDSEKAKNTAFLDAYPIEAVPTLLVLHPQTGEPVFKWEGSASLAQLRSFFDRATNALNTKPKNGEVEAALAEADRLWALNDLKPAAKAYRDVLEAAPKDWPERPRVLTSVLTALHATEGYELCARTAAEKVLFMPRDEAFAQATYKGLLCAMALDASVPAVEQWQKKMVALSREAAALPELLADTRADLYMMLIELRKSVEDKAGAKALAQEWTGFIRKNTQSSATAEGRSALDSHWVEAATTTGQLDEAREALQRSEKENPTDYNPPARLAYIYAEQGKLDEAVAAMDRALGKAYGPRKVSLFERKVELLLKQNNPAGARATYEKAVAFIGTLPEAQRSTEAQDRMKAKLPPAKP